MKLENKTINELRAFYLDRTRRKQVFTSNDIKIIASILSQDELFFSKIIIAVNPLIRFKYPACMMTFNNLELLFHNRKVLLKEASERTKAFMEATSFCEGENPTDEMFEFLEVSYLNAEILSVIIHEFAHIGQYNEYGKKESNETLNELYKSHRESRMGKGKVYSNNWKSMFGEINADIFAFDSIVKIVPMPFITTYYVDDYIDLIIKLVEKLDGDKCLSDDSFELFNSARPELDLDSISIYERLINGLPLKEEEQALIKNLLLYYSRVEEFSIDDFKYKLEAYEKKNKTSRL